MAGNMNRELSMLLMVATREGKDTMGINCLGAGLRLKPMNIS